MRENNEGFQPDRNVVAGTGEFRPTEEITLSVRVITRTASRRVAHAALELAQRRRQRLTIVHKNTVFKLGCGMFVEECRSAARAFPEVVVDEAMVDTFAMRLARAPQGLDVVVTTNLFGDILSDEAAGLVGGLGMAPGLCVGNEEFAMAQATHGSAPDIAGKGIANPYAITESTRMLIQWLGTRRGISEASATAVALRRALSVALGSPATRTPDIAGTGRTRDMVRGIMKALDSEAATKSGPRWQRD